MEYILQRIKSNNIYIFGAGAVSDMVYDYLKAYDLSDRILAFLVTELGDNAIQKHGLKVIELEKIKDIIKDSEVIVAVNSHSLPEVIETLKRCDIDNIIAIDSDRFVDLYFQGLYEKPIENNKILFQNQRGQGYGCNPKYIAEKIHEIDKSLDLVWAVSDVNKGFPDYIRPVEFGSRNYYSELATARVWVDNGRKSLNVRKREGQFYLQTWHGAAPIKKVEADAVHSLSDLYIRSAKHDSDMADLFLSGSKFYSELYKNSFWYTGDIMEVGLPRQDIFFSDNSLIKEKICRLYNICPENKIILYAPTFRSKTNTKCYDLDLERVRLAFCGIDHSSYTVLVSRHPINHQQYDFPSDASYISAEDYDDFEELLAVADVLITDYSGCAYDFSFTGKPVFMYQTDYEDYKKDRDFYIPMDRLPYIQAQSNDELIHKIKTFNYDTYKKSLDTFMKAMDNFDDGHAAEKIANYLIYNVIRQ